MEQTKNVAHTPGCWHIAFSDMRYGRKVYAIESAIDGRVAEVASTRANARLIAAAPDMLAALQSCLAALEYHDREAEYDWHSREIKLARAALAKAQEGAS